MRKFYDTGVIKNFVDPARIFIKDKKEDKTPAVDPAAAKAAEDAKAAEAATAARKAAGARVNGATAAALSPLQDVNSLNTKRRTLGSSN